MSEKREGKLSAASYLEELEREFSRLENEKPPDAKKLLETGQRLALHRATQGRDPSDLVPRMKAALSQAPKPPALPTKTQLPSTPPTLGSEPTPTPESQRRYEKLSGEEKDAVLDDLRAWMEQGLMSPEIKPSILGVGQDRFSCHGNKFDGNPLPEFCSISWNLLDCFAAAVISAPDLQFPAAPLLVRCRLGEAQRILKLHLVALLTENENIQPVVMTERCQVWIGSYLRPLAKTKGIELGSIHWDRSGPHLFFSFEYPGKMVRCKVAGLGESDPGGKARWPECELALGAIDSTMRLRAKQSVDFISRDLEGHVQ